MSWKRFDEEVEPCRLSIMERASCGFELNADLWLHPGSDRSYDIVGAVEAVNAHEPIRAQAQSIS